MNDAEVLIDIIIIKISKGLLQLFIQGNSHDCLVVHHYPPFVYASNLHDKELKFDTK